MQGKKTGGRVSGSLNKATADVKRAAQKHTAECLRILMAIARGKKVDPRARVSACKEILDRGHGRPKEHHELEAGERLADLVLRGARK